MAVGDCCLGPILLPAIFDNNTAQVVFERPPLVEQANEESKIVSLERVPDFAGDYLFASIRAGNSYIRASKFQPVAKYRYRPVLFDIMLLKYFIELKRLLRGIPSLPRRNRRIVQPYLNDLEAVHEYTLSDHKIIAG